MSTSTTTSPPTTTMPANDDGANDAADDDTANEADDEEPAMAAVEATEPVFVGAAVPIDAERAEAMAPSWRPGCPVGLDELRYLTVTHWDFTGAAATGELVVHEDHADDIVAVMERLFEIGFPIERMELIDVYDGDDDRSMAANNTSAFNCREVAWRPGVWSNHAYGTAIDVNPLINPYVAGDVVLPPEGRPFADRSTTARGGVYPGDAVVEAFADIGWGWGGDWSKAKDWQHFSASGR